MNKNKHLTLEDRKTIESAIRNNSSKTAIAKEIRLHRHEKKNNTSFFYSDCALLKQCGICDHYCTKYVASICKRRDRSPGACMNPVHICKPVKYRAFQLYTMCMILVLLTSIFHMRKR